MRLEKFKWLSDYQLENVKKIIKKHYHLSDVSDTLVISEFQNLSRKEKLGTLDDNQELLMVQLEQELLK